MHGSFALLPCLSWAPEKMLITKFRFGLQCLIKGNYYTAISSLLLSFLLLLLLLRLSLFVVSVIIIEIMSMQLSYGSCVVVAC